MSLSTQWISEKKTTYQLKKHKWQKLEYFQTEKKTYGPVYKNLSIITNKNFSLIF